LNPSIPDLDLDSDSPSEEQIPVQSLLLKDDPIDVQLPALSLDQNIPVVDVATIRVKSVLAVTPRQDLLPAVNIFVQLTPPFFDINKFDNWLFIVVCSFVAMKLEKSGDAVKP
jgi:hypothetical protein